MCTSAPIFLSEEPRRGRRQTLRLHIRCRFPRGQPETLTADSRVGRPGLSPGRSQGTKAGQAPLHPLPSACLQVPRTKRGVRGRGSVEGRGSALGTQGRAPPGLAESGATCVSARSERGAVPAGRGATPGGRNPTWRGRGGAADRIPAPGGRAGPGAGWGGAVPGKEARRSSGRAGRERRVRDFLGWEGLGAWPGRWAGPWGGAGSREGRGPAGAGLSRWGSFSGTEVPFAPSRLLPTTRVGPGCPHVRAPLSRPGHAASSLCLAADSSPAQRGEEALRNY